MIESPVFELPMPINGAPPPVKLVADWLPIPLLDPELLEPNAESLLEPSVEPEVPGVAAPGPLVGDPNVLVLEPVLDELPNPPTPGPEAGDPNAEVEEEVEDPAAPAPIAPCDAIPAAVPSPGVNPANGWPKKPFTVVLFSPTLIIRQSDLPVRGSI